MAIEVLCPNCGNQCVDKAFKQERKIAQSSLPLLGRMARVFRCASILESLQVLPCIPIREGYVASACRCVSILERRAAIGGSGWNVEREGDNKHNEYKHC